MFYRWLDLAILGHAEGNLMVSAATAKQPSNNFISACAGLLLVCFSPQVLTNELASSPPSSSASTGPIPVCFYGQQVRGHNCEGDPQLLSAFDFRQLPGAELQGYLPTPAQLKAWLQHPTHADNVKQLKHVSGTDTYLLTSEFVRHGSEFLVTAVALDTRQVELRPWRQPLFVLLLRP